MNKEMTDAVIETLAALEHDQWMSWSKSVVKTEPISPNRYKTMGLPLDAIRRAKRGDERT